MVPRNHFATLRTQPLDSYLFENRFPLDLLTGNYLEALHCFALRIESLGFHQGSSILGNPKAHCTLLTVSRRRLHEDYRTSDGPYPLFSLVLSVFPINKPQRKIFVGNVSTAHGLTQSRTGQDLLSGGCLVG